MLTDIQELDAATDQLSDAQLVELVTETIGRPTCATPTSFTLHAPLEITARAALLPMVPPAARQAVRARMVQVAATYDALGPTLPPPPDPSPAPLPLDALVASGDVDGADRALTWLAQHGDSSEAVRALAETLLPRLSGAGHGVIGVDQARRGRAPTAAGLLGLRNIVREAAALPDWTLTWFEQTPRTGQGSTSLWDALSDPPSPGDPGSDFIYPVMSLTESSGLALDRLAGPLRGARIAEVEPALLRIAAHSMLQDDPVRAPYGWSHCLTLPQGALGTACCGASPATAMAVAATYVLGFRAVQGTCALDPAFVPPASTAAGDAWRATPEQRPGLVAELASVAAAHHDAHLAKYTLACIDAARRDPDATALYLAAAAHLAEWWRDARR
jgi:hypothetical protein